MLLSDFSYLLTTVSTSTEVDALVRSMTSVPPDSNQTSIERLVDLGFYAEVVEIGPAPS